MDRAGTWVKRIEEMDVHLPGSARVRNSQGDPEDQQGADDAGYDGSRGFIRDTREDVIGYHVVEGVLGKSEEAFLFCDPFQAIRVSGSQWRDNSQGDSDQ